MEFTERDNRLLELLDGACEDYSQDEIVLALARKLYDVSINPFAPLEREQTKELIVEGNQTLYRLKHQTGRSREEALLLACGFVSGIAEHYRPGRKIPVE